jgi:hypothetical protein
MNDLKPQPHPLINAINLIDVRLFIVLRHHG